MSGGVLVAGIGNVFLGDDGFGVEVARRLYERELPEDVEVVDFGIKGMDLVYALMDEWDGVILVDAAPRGEEPGTLVVIEAEVDGGEAALDVHSMDPVKVLGMARAMGAKQTRTLVVGCEPAYIVGGEDYDEMVMELSEPVRAAVGEAVKLVESLIGDLRSGEANEVNEVNSGIESGADPERGR